MRRCVRCPDNRQAAPDSSAPAARPHRSRCTLWWIFPCPLLLSFETAGHGVESRPNARADGGSQRQTARFPIPLCTARLVAGQTSVQYTDYTRFFKTHPMPYGATGTHPLPLTPASHKWQQRGNSRRDTRRHLAVFSEQESAYLCGFSACLECPLSDYESDGCRFESCQAHPLPRRSRFAQSLAREYTALPQNRRR
jgi:hypothetical protein